ncbi:MAG: hypothetical protein NC489_12725 [Ruminococcus flavefaciens]|nr:hypothetical protein [Ruminococcus flavefaciens]
MDNLNYSIEDHLRSFRDYENFKILYNCWKIEKAEYTNRLSTVGMTYQTYSLHDASHSETILKQIAYFLGEERIRQLSPTDAWMILESAYCHDLGMVVTARQLYDGFASMSQEEFEKLSRSMYESDNYDIKASWSYLEPLFKYGQKAKKGKKDIWDIEKNENTEKYKNLDNLISIFHSKSYEWPLHFTKAFMVLIQEYCRPKHAKMSHDMIAGESEKKTYEGVIPIRLRLLIAEISLAHTDERDNLLEKLSYKVQGFNGDYAHPRYVAELIRIGDLLDMDNNRFNQYQLAVAGTAGDVSYAHQLKHKAVRDFLITPKEIRVKADFRAEDAQNIYIGYGQGKKTERLKPEHLNALKIKAFKELSGWLQMLRQELNFFRQNWLRIVPDDLSGNCPYFEPELLLIDGENIEKDLIDLRYHITAKRASEIIEGSGLYEDSFVAFIREVLQNSMDAIKRKIYVDLERKNYNNSKKGFCDKFSNPLEFYRYISRDINQILIQVECKKTAKGKNYVICFTIRDRGIGISYERLKGMQHIGDIPDYRTSKQAQCMPAWWKPTGSFGIGMQTIFYFSKIFKMRTRTEEEKILRVMEFHSTQVGGKIDASFDNSHEEMKKFGFGTEVKIEIPMEMMKLFQQCERFGRNSDYFGKTVTVYKNKIKETIQYIRGSFGLPVNLNLIEKDKNILSVEKYLTCCFGKYFIDLTNSRIEKVLEKEIEGEIEEKYSGFSCWDSGNEVLIRYRWPLNNQKEPTLKVYFNEIRVDDYALQKMLQIYFWDVEIYLFEECAENFLEVNRDKFLYEKYRYIVDAVCTVHLRCLRFLLQDSDGKEKHVDKCRQKYKEAIWQENDKLGYHKSVKDYFDLLINGRPVSVFNTSVNWFVQNRDMLTVIGVGELDNYINRHIEKNFWLMDTRNKYAGTMHLRNCNADEVNYIVEDAFSAYMDLAVTELRCMEDIYKNYVIIYKVNKRSGIPLTIAKHDFEAYVRMRYGELNMQDSEQERMLLPGINDYRELCVSRLMYNLGTEFEKKWDSTIIMPVTMKELKKILKQADEEKVAEIVNKNLLASKNSSYVKIREYIKLYGIGKEASKKEIKEAYQKLLIEIWKILR